MKKKLFKIYFVIFSFLIILIYLCNGLISQYVWESYGNDFNPFNQAQSSSAYGLLGTTRSNMSKDYGYHTSLFPYSDQDGLTYQPLVAHFNITSDYQEYLVFPNLNYLQIYNKNLNLVREIYTGGEIVSQIDTMYWTDDTSSKDIAGVWKINSTDLAFKIYSYNSTSGNLYLRYNKNYTSLTNVTIAGVRHLGKNAIFMLPISLSGSNFSSRFIILNSSGTTELNLYNRPCFYTQPINWADMDNDGKYDYLTYCVGSSTGGGSLIVFNDDGTIKYSYTASGGGAGYRKLLDVKILKTDLTNNWRLVILEGEQYFSTFHYLNSWITAKKLDGTTIWTKSYGGTFQSGYKKAGQYGKIALADYNNDGIDDVYVATLGTAFTTFYFNTLSFKILDSTSGNELTYYDMLDVGEARGYEGVTSLTLADINNDGYDDILFSHQDGYFLFNPVTNYTYNYTNMTTCSCSYLYSSCIPADLNFDGFQEVICSGKNKTNMYYSGELNQNAQIISVTYSPSTSITRLSSVDVIINASDYEGDSPLYYIKKCSDDDGWSSDSPSNIQSCFYSLSGNYNLTIGVRDPYHTGEYNYFSQNILVTETGTICGNSICETGENNVNCPSDCSSNVTTIQSEGGIILPTEIVNMDNTQQGLLPEIYYGILGFLSQTLSPMIILIFVIFFVLIMIAIATIIRRIAIKVSG